MKDHLTKITIILFFCIFTLNANAQYTISGEFPYLAGQKVRLIGFEGFDIYTIDSTKVSADGNFKLSYSKTDRGMGYLTAEDDKSYTVVLANEDIHLKGELLSAPQSVVSVSGKENQLFTQYAIEHSRRQQAMSAWDYLQKIYELDSLFIDKKKPKQAINKEIDRINREDKDFLKSLGNDSYVSWFLPLRKLVSSVSYIAQYNTKEIPAAIKTFREMDYTDIKLYKSGMLRETIENHYWLIENSGRSLDSVFIEMNISTDYLIENLSQNEERFNEITNFIFDLLESRSLYQSAEYIAIKALTQNACALHDNLAMQLETYRAMKVGNTAPDVEFKGDVLIKGKAINEPKYLSNLEANYYVVVFGATWCPACTNDLPQIAALYNKWKQYGVEVVFISLDTEKTSFMRFAKNFPFISICDYKKWETKAAKDYHVFATPQMYLLDSKRKILLRPNSAAHMDSWVEWFFVQGNK